MSRAILRAVASLGMLVLPDAVLPLRAGEFNEESDKVTLSQAHLSTDGSALLAFLRERSGPPHEIKDVDAQIEQLGNLDFEKREAAAKALVSAGTPVLPQLRKAAKHQDAEIARRAADCIAVIERGHDPVVLAAVVRMLARVGPEGAVDALFGFLPSADDEDLREEVWFALDAAAVRERKVPPSVVRGAGASEASRRAAAGYLLARRGDAAQRAAAKKLLTDPDALVRLRTAQGFLGANDKAGVPALIALLGDAPVALAWQAEEMLHYAADEKDAPEAVIGTGAAEERKRCRGAWEAWWRKAEPALDLSRRQRESRRPILYLTYLVYAGDAGNIRLSGCDGRARWTLMPAGRLSDAHLLPGGTLLLAVHTSGPRVKATDPYGLSERDVTGRVLWEYKTRGIIWCQPLRGGEEVTARIEGFFDPDTPVAEPRTKEGEVRRGGKTIHFVRPRDQAELTRAQTSSDLRGGATLEFANDYKEGPRRVVERDARGKVVWETAVYGADAMRLCLPLVRLGFDAPRPADLDLDSVPARIAGLASRNLAFRDLCAGALGRMRHKAVDAIPALLDMADAPDARGRVEAFSALAHILRPEDYPTVRKATADKRPCVREAAVRLLANFFPEQRKEALPIVFERLHDADPAVRWEAVRMLNPASPLKPDPKQVIPALIAALKDNECPHGDKRYSVGAEAAFVLVQHQPDPRVAVPALQEVLVKGGEPVRCAVLRELARLAGRDASFAPAVLATAVDVLQHDGSSEVRRAAAGALGALGKRAESAVPELIKVVQAKSRPASERESAIYGLETIGAGAVKAIPALEQSLQDDDPLVRQAAAEVLKNLRRAHPSLPK